MGGEGTNRWPDERIDRKVGRQVGEQAGSRVGGQVGGRMDGRTDELEHAQMGRYGGHSLRTAI